MVKNPFKRKKRKNPFEASMPLDKPEAKVVEARYQGKPFLVAFGKAKQREVKGAGGVGTEGVKGEYQSQKDLNWQVLYNLKALPSGFIPEEKLEDWMAGTISVASGGNATVFNEDTRFIEADPTKLEETKDRDPQQWLMDEWWKAQIEYAEREETKKKKKKSESK